MSISKKYSKDFKALQNSTVVADALGSLAYGETYLSKLIVKNQIFGFRHCITKKEREEMVNKKGISIDLNERKFFEETNEYWDRLNFTVF